MPYTIIVDDTDLKTVGGSELDEEAITPREPEDRFAYGPRASRSYFATNGVFAGDADTRSLNINVFGLSPVQRNTISLERLGRCAPSLPPWLIAGLVGKPFGLLAEGNVVMGHVQSDTTYTLSVVFRGPLWVSIENTKRLKNEIDSWKRLRIDVPFTPLGEFFAGPPPEAEGRALWESEAALFVRWGLFPPSRSGPEWRESFLRFVQRARYGPVTEQMFKECFGQGFGAMERVLTDYLEDVIAKPVETDLDFPPSYPEPELKPATPDQIGRILGDWLRMEGQSVHQQNPAMGAKLLDAAGRMLRRAYAMDNGLPPDVEPALQDEGTSRPAPKQVGGPVVRMKPFIVTAERIHDPGLLAVFGLYERDIGENAKARELLEKAVQGGVVRPMAYVVLAQLRYAEAMAKASGQGGKLSTSQAAWVIEPAQVALRFSPTADAWSVIVESMDGCEAVPSAVDVEKIAAGVSRFPHDTRLALRAAQLCVKTGNTTSAAELLDRSLPFATDEGPKRAFQELQSSVAAGSGAR